MSASSIRNLVLGTLALLTAFAVAGVLMQAPATGSIQVSPERIDFDDVMVGGADEHFVMVTNLGDERVVLDRLEVAAPFSVNLLEISLEPGESRTVHLRFAPTESGPADAVFTLAGDAGSVDVALSGRGDGIPQASFDPPGLSFGEVGIGQSASGVVKITNGGSGTLRLDDWRAQTPFEVASAVDRIAPGDSAEVRITFAPPAAISFQRAIELTSNDPGAPLIRVPVSGSGVEGAVAASIDAAPGQLDFGAVPVGATRKGWVAIRNHGEATLTLASVMVPEGFEASTRSRQIAPGGVLSFPVVFKPAAKGPRNGVLRIHSNDPTAEATVVQLLGEGSDWNDPRVTAALTAPGSRELTAVGATPGSRLGRNGAAADRMALLRDGELEPGEAGEAPAGPELLDGSYVGMGVWRMPIEDFDYGEFTYNPASGELRLDDIELPMMHMGMEGSYDILPTQGIGSVNELGDIEMTIPLEIVDRFGNHSRVDIEMTSGTVIGMHQGYPISRTGSAVGPDGIGTVVGIGTFDVGGPLGSFSAEFALQVKVDGNEVTATVGGSEITETAGGS